jgi:hypothetical protein
VCSGGIVDATQKDICVRRNSNSDFPVVPCSVVITLPGISRPLEKLAVKVKLLLCISRSVWGRRCIAPRILIWL